VFAATLTCGAIALAIVLGAIAGSAFASDAGDSHARPLFDFAAADAAQAWRAVNDGVMGGVSTGEARVTEEHTLRFAGTLSLENDGGFASIWSAGPARDLQEFDGLYIRARGDGRRYRLTVRTDFPIAAGSYRREFGTTPETWIEVFLPFAEFEASSYGRPVAGAPPLNRARVASIGFLLADKKAGPFALEVAWIKAHRGVPLVRELKPGDKAPEFALLAQDGKATRLAAHRGHKLLLYFYPKADTPGCTTQACSVRDSIEELKKLDLAVIGASPDRPEDQKKFDEKYGLDFPLLADPDKNVARLYGAVAPRIVDGKLVESIIRSAFLLDEKGVIAATWYKVDPIAMVPEARKALEK
jgi:peroxiredoxin